MDKFFLFLGTVGAVCFALSGVPQAIKSWREGHSKGISHGTIILWLVGEGCMLAYALYFYTRDIILTANYTFNFMFVSVIFKYKYWPRIRKTETVLLLENTLLYLYGIWLGFMLKMHKEKRIINKVIVDDIICNKCGNSLKDRCDMNYEGLVEISFDGGYASKIGDMTRVTFSMCEDCLIEMFEGFAIEPHYGGYEIDDEEVEGYPFSLKENTDNEV